MKKQIFNTILKFQSQVIRLCLRYGIKYQELSELLKNAYVQEAKKFLLSEDNNPSVSRMSVMTGVHRKDISNLISGTQSERKKPNFIARIISDWQYHPKFSKNNKPNSLSTTGRDSEFAQLVNHVTGGDSDPYTTLFEMQRIGAVQLNEKSKTVNLLWSEYAPEVVENEALEMLIEDSNDLYDCIIANIDKTEDELPNLHLKTEYTRIPESALPKIKQWLLEEGSAFHKKTSTYLAKFDLDLNNKNTSGDTTQGAKEFRVSLATFSISEAKIELNKSQSNLKSKRVKKRGNK